MEGDSRGFVKQWRKEIDSEVWLKPPLYTRFWLWLKMAVDYKTGSMTTTYSQMAEAIAWVERGVLKRPNRKTLYEILGWFEGNSMVTVQSNRQYTTITLINWHLYNSNTNTKVTQNGQPEVTEDGQEDGHSLRSNKKLKEVQEEKKEREDHGTLYSHPENLSLPDSKDLKLDTKNSAVDRWVNAFHNYRPGGGHPFRNLPQPDIQDVKQRVQDFIDWQGEEKAIALLKEIFSNPQKPSSVKQAIMFCNKIAEKKEVEQTKLPSFSNKCPECGHFGIMDNLRNPTPQTQGVAPKWIGIKHFVCSKCNYRLKATEEMIAARKQARQPKEEETVSWLNQ